MISAFAAIPGDIRLLCTRCGGLPLPARDPHYPTINEIVTAANNHHCRNEYQPRRAA